MKPAASQTLTIFDALVEILDLSVGDAAARKAKRHALRANPARVRLLAGTACMRPSFKALLSASMRLASGS
ncbi:hypothetical protein [Prosthecobacter sp.]|uniref:hypothetical protein n=1 Tax=Prosthecobacter sp. TaxID=1965333 RepID=UPI003783D1C5